MSRPAGTTTLMAELAMPMGLMAGPAKKITLMAGPTKRTGLMAGPTVGGSKGATNELANETMGSVLSGVPSGENIGVHTLAC